jgi:hypothetical protein
MPKRLEVIPPEQWGKDHLSTLLYVETRCVDYGGELSAPHLRRYRGRLGGHDNKKYPTILKDGTEIHLHDDYDCLIDMEAEGLLIYSDGSLNVKLLEPGWVLAHMLRRIRANGGNVVDADVVAILEAVKERGE